MILFFFSTVQFSKIEEIALLWAEKEWGYRNIEKVIPYYGPNLDTTAYAFIFSDGTNLDMYLNKYPYKKREDYDYKKKREGVGIFGTVVVSANKDAPPVLEISNCLPLYYTRQYIVNNPTPQLIYVSPAFQWYLEGKFLKSLFDNASIKLKDLQTNLMKLHSSLHKYDDVWKNYENDNRLLVKDSNMIEGVPAFTWSYGCSPTASAMIMAYWNNKGYNRFIDYYFDRYDPPERDYDVGVANVHQELAVAMNTDTLSGGTSIYSIANGHIKVGEDNGYDITSYTFSCNSGNRWGWDLMKDEIDNERPAHWAVLNYYHPSFHGPINHSICAIGYEATTEGDTFFIIHNTWDVGVHKWSLYTTETSSYSFIYPVIPDGAEDYEVNIESPLSKVVLFKNMKYAIKFFTKGYYSKLNLWFAPGQGSDLTQWVKIGETTEDSFEWVPEQIGEGRINIEMVDDGIKAADGVRYCFSIEDPGNIELDILFHLYSPRIVDYDFQYPYLVIGGDKDVLIYSVRKQAKLLRYLSLENEVRGVLLHNNQIVVQDQEGSLWIYNMSGELLHKIAVNSKGKGIVQYENKIISLLYDTGIKMYDMDNYKEVFNFDETIRPLSFSISGDTLFVATTKGVEIFRIENNSVKQLSFLDIGAILSVAKYGNGLYCSKGNKEPVYYNFNTGDTTTLNPGLQGILYFSAVKDLIFALSSNTLKILKEISPGDVDVIDTFYVQFKPSTKVKASNYFFAVPTEAGIFICNTTYDLGKDENIRKFDKVEVHYYKNELIINNYKGNNEIEIFNVLGRLVKKGRNKERYEVGNLVNGVYFYTLKIGRSTYRGKIVITR